VSEGQYGATRADNSNTKCGTTHSFAKEPYKRDDILQKSNTRRPVQITATPNVVRLTLLQRCMAFWGRLSLPLTHKSESCTIYYYGVAKISRLLKMIGLFCKRALLKRVSHRIAPHSQEWVLHHLVLHITEWVMHHLLLHITTVLNGAWFTLLMWRASVFCKDTSCSVIPEGFYRALLQKRPIIWHLIPEGSFEKMAEPMWVRGNTRRPVHITGDIYM